MTATGTIFDLAQTIATGNRSAQEVVRECVDGIEASDAALHAFLRVDRERALARAGDIDAARTRGDHLGPLAGVPIALKNNICTTGGPTTCGSRMLETFHSQYSAHVVERLEAAGAVIVGHTNLDEFAMGSSTENSAFGVTRNPWDLSRVAGGSSGGSAAAVAARMVPGALGSDTGGSIRQPAALCGVVGLKPTYGRVSRYGLVAFGSSLDQIGPITTDVRDAALMLGVIAGHDPRDSTSVDTPVPDYLASLDRSLKGVRVGVAESCLGGDAEPSIRDRVRESIAALGSAGAEIVPIELPHMKYAVACYYLVAPAEASSNLARYDGVHYGYRAKDASDIVDLYAASRGEAFGAEVKRRIMLGTYALSAGYHDAYYLQALKVRTLIKRDVDRAFEQVDVIASPVSPCAAHRVGEKIDDPLAAYLSDVYTVAANLAGNCAISLPCGLDPTGLPIGLQLMGPALGEERLLAVAHQFQLLTDHHTKPPPLAASA